MENWKKELNKRVEFLEKNMDSLSDSEFRNRVSKINELVPTDCTLYHTKFERLLRKFSCGNRDNEYINDSIYG